MSAAPTQSRPFRLLFVALALICAGSSSARAGPKACDGLRFGSVGVAVLNFDPFDQTRETLDLEVPVQLESGRQCEISLAVQSLVPGVYREFRGSEAVRYEIRLADQLVQNDLAAPTPTRLKVQPQGREGVIRLRFELPVGVLVGAGEYNDVLTLRAYDASKGAARQIGQDTTIQARLIVPARVRLLLDGQMASANSRFGQSIIDLGDLADGANESAMLQVRTTAGVRLTVSSQNKGRLLHRFQADTARPIAYSLVLDGQTASLRDGPALLSRPRQPNANRYNVRLNIVVPPSPDRLAGVYRDQLTITAEPN